MSVERRLRDLRERYAAAHPGSADLARRAAQWMPGGNTRSVLHFDPFPMVIASGQGDRVVDIDGNSYIDCAGEFSAGLYGHGNPIITAAQRKALEDGLALAGPNRYEAAFAQVLCERFTSLERVRFCNSGTEANLFALATARCVTNRSKILVFKGAYHGGVLTFGAGGGPMNVPFEVVRAPFNQPEETLSVIAANAGDLAAVIVEPVLGAAGNLAADLSFLECLRSACSEYGIVLVFDEVKTSRLSAGGMQGRVGVTPDMTTLGKYLGAGLSFGAFGGRANIMERFNPEKPDALKHAGTFNNNVMSMAGGLAGLQDVFTRQRANEFFCESEECRHQLNAGFERIGLPVRASGLGSMISLHLGCKEPRRLDEIDPRTATLRRLVHLRCIAQGLVTTPRGDIFLSLPMSKSQLVEIRKIIFDVVKFEISHIDK